MITKEIIAQAIGIIAMAIGAVSLLQKNTKGIRIIQIISATLFATNYFLLGAFSGAALNILSMTRNIIIGYKDKKWANPKFWYIFFVVAFAVAVFFSGDGWLGLLPFAGCIFMGTGLYIDKASIARRFIFCSSPCWLIYNFAAGTIGGVIAEIINLVAIGSSIIRYDIKKGSN